LNTNRQTPVPSQKCTIIIAPKKYAAVPCRRYRRYLDVARREIDMLRLMSGACEKNRKEYRHRFVAFSACPIGRAKRCAQQPLKS
jgi:hypothetical protein